MASNFPAYVTLGHDKATTVEEYTPGQDTNEPFIYGDFVYIDTADGSQAKRCGANPTLIAGISEVDSEFNRTITENGKVPVRLFTGSDAVRVAMSSATTPAESHVGNSYGITRDGTTGNWQLDISKTTTTSRMRVTAVDISLGIFYCVPHQNVLQFADIQVATA